MTGVEYRADPDASALDREVMALAQRLHDAGWAEDAESVASAMAELREGVGNERPQHDGSLCGLYDSLFMIATSAAQITAVLHRCFPDELEIRR